MAAGEYPGSTLYPASSSNYSVACRPASNPINKIITHVVQGSWAGAINLFPGPKAQVSAHYTVRSSDESSTSRSGRTTSPSTRATDPTTRRASVSSTRALSAIQAGLPKQCTAPQPSSRPTCATSPASRKTGPT